jgi:hypothetical protein
MKTVRSGTTSNRDCDDLVSFFPSVSNEKVIKFLLAPELESRKAQEDVLITLERIEGRLDILDDIYEKVNLLISQDGSTPELIVVEQIDKMTLKQRVFDFLKTHEDADIEQLHKSLKCDIGQLIEVVDELVSEKKIEG